jgi:hypothetical protein
MIVEMGDYAWSEHIVPVYLACQITIKKEIKNCYLTGVATVPPITA